jgi:hypothetical protein
MHRMQPDQNLNVVFPFADYLIGRVALRTHSTTAAGGLTACFACQ